MGNNLKTVTLPDAMGVPLVVGDWVAYTKGALATMNFGQIVRFNNSSLVVAPRKGKDFRVTTPQVIKISEEQLTLYWFSL